MPSQVIINADDFGINAKENRVILAALRQGVVSSTTLMANMPGLAEACDLVRSEGLQGRVGLHLNLSHGRPLTGALAGERLFCNAQGEFDPHLSHYHLRLPQATRRALDEELEAQWQKCLDHGVHPSHLDSHQHMHNIWPIGVQVAHFAARKGVPMRLARNLGGNIGWVKRLYKTLLNRRLRALAGASADYVCTPADLLDQTLPRTGTLEVIAHPYLLAEGFGDDYLADGQSLDELLAERLAGVPRVTYTALAQRPAPCNDGVAY